MILFFLEKISWFIVHHYTILIVVAGSALVGAIASSVGVFALLRKQSLLGDTISHAAFPGIAMMFLLTGSTNPFILNIGGMLAGCLGTLFMLFLLHRTSIKQDTLLGIILSVFFGFGLVLKTIIQKRGLPHQAVLGKFFFGNASTMLSIDIVILCCVALFITLILGAFWKEFKIIAFDREFALSVGYPVFVFDIVITFMMVVAIVIGLHVVGVLLMSAMLIAPAAAARQWTVSVEKMMILSIIIGIFAGVGGALLSSAVEHLPTGPTIVIIMSCIVVISLLFAPHRGVLRRQL